MAFDKIIDSAKLDGALSATADAIRSKTGATDSIPWDETAGFKTAVESMEIGGTSVSEWETVMPATDITFVDGGEYITFEDVYPLTLGTKYKVEWGGVEYTSVAVQTVFQEMDTIAIGNVGALAGNPSTEPFVIGYIPAANGFGIFRLDGSDEAVNVTIYVSTIPVPVILPLEITENGSYAAPDGVDGYSPVTVNVSSGSTDLGGLETATLTFMNEDGTQTLGTRPIIKGDTAGDPVETGLFEEPTKEETLCKKFVYGGWSNEPNATANAETLSDIEGDKTVYCAYDTINQIKESTVTTKADNEGNIMATLGAMSSGEGIITGKKYKVTFEGKEYTLTAKDYTLRGSGNSSVKAYRCLGNITHFKSSWGTTISHTASANTGEPFLLMLYFGLYCALYTATAGTYTVSAIEV